MRDLVHMGPSLSFTLFFVQTYRHSRMPRPLQQHEESTVKAPRPRRFSFQMETHIAVRVLGGEAGQKDCALESFGVIVSNLVFVKAWIPVC